MRSAWAGLLFLGWITTGCVSTSRIRAGERDALLTQLRIHGFEGKDPSALDSDAQARVRREVGMDGSSAERLRRLTQWITGASGLDFQRSLNITLDADAALIAQGGDCMAFSNLYTGAARALEVETFFVHVTEALIYYQESGQFFSSSHIAVGFNDGDSMRVVDLANVDSRWTVAIYTPISDRAASALYFNNRAVEQLLAGDAGQSVALLTALLAEEQGLPELYSNLGVALIRLNRHARALDVLREGLARFPSYRSLYTNAVQAARGAGNMTLASDIENRGRDIASTDPFFLFGEGLNLYQHADYREAAVRFERAARSQPKSAVIQAWRTRAYLSAGEERAARNALDALRGIDPEHPLVRALDSHRPM